MTIQDKLKIQTYLSVVIVVAGATHLFFGVYFALLDIPFVVLLNVFDVFVYIGAFFINKAGKTRMASFIIVFKIIVFSLMATFLFGTNVNAQWFVMVAALPAALYLDFSKFQKVCIIATMPFLISIQLFFPLLFPPPFYMYDNNLLEFLFANIIVLSFILTITLNTIITSRISDLQMQQVDEFKHMSNIDALTELSNRRHAEQFFDKLDDLPSIFCLIDIDNFKAVNDTYGHDAGDAVLSTVAGILRKNTRQTDLVCRWGGEEFLVVLPKCNSEVGHRILEKMRKTVEDETIHTDSNEIKVTITGGAAVLTDSDIKLTLSICDKNLYEGKRSGKNKIII